MVELAISLLSAIPHLLLVLPVVLRSSAPLVDAVECLVARRQLVL